MDRECGDRNGRNMSPITRASMVHRGYDDFAGRGNAASYEVDRPHSTQVSDNDFYELSCSSLYEFPHIRIRVTIFSV